jgi:hypothetical protein
MGKIDWTEFEGNYVALEGDTAKKLVLTNWRQEIKAFQDDENVAVAFDVVEEDDKDVWVENPKDKGIHHARWRKVRNPIRGEGPEPRAQAVR